MIAVLFARSDSHYKALPDCDVYDIDRDARTFSGGVPVVAHPPCRAWGCLSHMAKPRPDEKELGLFAAAQVRDCGGVLEHPAHSKLWAAAGLPQPGQVDAWGGFTLPVLQSWWGHEAPKKTWFYVCGVAARDLPKIPFSLGIPPGRIERMSVKKREATPPELAEWLVEVARRCSR